MLTIMTMMSIMFIMSFHPLSMGAILLIQTILTSIFTSTMSSSPWFSYMLFLIMVGGMLILFMYMTSIASNEKFKIKPLTTLMMILIPMLMMEKLPFMNSKEMFSMKKEIQPSLIKFLYQPLFNLTIFLMIYLLITMIASVKITKFKQGSIRQMN